MLIGLFMLTGVVIMVGLVMFLRPSVGDEGQSLVLRFSNINKINVGTRVLFAGKAVGEVTKIDQIYHARDTQPTDSLGRLFFYQLTLKIDSNIVVYNTDEISISTSGLLGEKSISITPRAATPGIIPVRITDKTPFYADSIDPIENTFTRLSDIGEKLDDTIELVKQWIIENQDDLSSTVASLSSAMEQIDCIVKGINDEQIIPEVGKSSRLLSSALGRIDKGVTQMEQDAVFSNMGELVDHFKVAGASIEKIAGDIAAGKGTIGRLLEDDDMYLRLTAILSKADTTMNDINHYGILFHLNKGWQRTRTRRMNMMNALNTPEQFKEYFQNEINQINTAMARISMLITKAQAKSDDIKVLESPRFKQDFADLLRQVDEMSDTLRLYNENLMNAKNN
jgi:phospholipid/cholesterol/gamma-HCH transport system substrate-binding protein